MTQDQFDDIKAATAIVSSTTSLGVVALHSAKRSNSFRNLSTMIRYRSNAGSSSSSTGGSVDVTVQFGKCEDAGRLSGRRVALITLAKDNSAESAITTAFCNASIESPDFELDADDLPQVMSARSFGQEV